jgi:peptidyl-prolyl cis-trans isomerase SurA
MPSASSIPGIDSRSDEDYEMKKSIWAAMVLLAASVSTSAKVVDRIVAQVNDDIITLSDMKREMADIRQELASKFAGDQLEQEVKKAEKDVLEELIRQKLILQKANEVGFNANADAQVAAALQKIMKDNGLKDAQELEQALERSGLSLTGFRDRIKKSIISNSLVQEFVGSRITLLTQEVERYYRDHKAEFSVPEEVALSEIVIPTDGTTAADADARARDIRQRVVAGESFATLASQYSKGATAGKGGGIGSYLTAKLNPEIAKAIAEIKEGECTQVLPMKEGFVIMRVDTRRAASVRPLEEVRDAIRNQLYQTKFAPEYEKFITSLKEEAYIQRFDDVAAK